MTKDTQCTFQITIWDEKTYQEIVGGTKLSNAKVTQAYSGTIEGTYSAHSTATSVGLERVSGRVDGKAGTFVLQHIGSFSEGKESSVAGRGMPAQVSLSYSFAPNT